MEPKETPREVPEKDNVKLLIALGGTGTDTMGSILRAARSRMEPEKMSILIIDKEEEPK